MQRTPGTAGGDEGPPAGETDCHTRSSPAHLHGHVWGSTAYQVPSGGSIVSMSPREKVVYKYPLKRRETETLQNLHKARLALQQCSFPLSVTPFPTCVNSPASGKRTNFLPYNGLWLDKRQKWSACHYESKWWLQKKSCMTLAWHTSEGCHQ